MVFVGPPLYRLERMRMSHMAADTASELHAMADTIGLPRHYFQPGRHPHYDVSLGKRRLAVAAGATEADERHILAVAKRCAHAVQA